MSLDMETYLNNAVQAARKKSFAKSDQLTLGEIISKIENILKQNQEEIPLVCYDFEYLYPTSIDSWRGSYSELALSFEGENNPPKADKFLEVLKDAVGKTFTGYKGGEFFMSRHTPVWVANRS
jgi:hypothetical protein